MLPRLRTPAKLRRGARALRRTRGMLQRSCSSLLTHQRWPPLARQPPPRLSSPLRLPHMRRRSRPAGLRLCSRRRSCRSLRRAVRHSHLRLPLPRGAHRCCPRSYRCRCRQLRLLQISLITQMPRAALAAPRPPMTPSLRQMSVTARLHLLRPRLLRRPLLRSLLRSSRHRCRRMSHHRCRCRHMLRSSRRRRRRRPLRSSHRRRHLLHRHSCRRFPLPRPSRLSRPASLACARAAHRDS